MLSHFIHPAWAASALSLFSKSWRCCSAAALLEAFCACNKKLPVSRLTMKRWSHKRINQPETLNGGLKFSKLFTKLQHLNTKEVIPNSYKSSHCHWQTCHECQPHLRCFSSQVFYLFLVLLRSSTSRGSTLCLAPNTPNKQNILSSRPRTKMLQLQYSMATFFLYESTAEACLDFRQLVF